MGGGSGAAPDEVTLCRGCWFFRRKARLGLARWRAGVEMGADPNGTEIQTPHRSDTNQLLIDLQTKNRKKRENPRKNKTIDESKGYKNND